MKNISLFILLIRLSHTQDDPTNNTPTPVNDEPVPANSSVEGLNDDPVGTIDDFFKQYIDQNSLNPNIKLPPNTSEEMYKKCYKTYGLTWAHRKHDCERHLDLVSCHGQPLTGTGTISCNPYKGDTLCATYLPILCIKDVGYPRPNYNVTGTCSKCAMPIEFYYGWTEGIIKLSPRIRGCHIYNKAHADRICQHYFGCGWRMSAHHDGKWKSGMNSTTHYGSTWTSPIFSGGWQHWSIGNITNDPQNNVEKTRFWVYIRDQKYGNCWDLSLDQ